MSGLAIFSHFFRKATILDTNIDLAIVTSAVAAYAFVLTLTAASTSQEVNITI
jgi:hypothetical protein